jgi:16S rRNA (adenine1518-N6/adenine1519-N6)-dimethyltransferase
MMTNESPARKSLGQHWLRDGTVLADIIGSARLTPEDTVLEIGPGLGSLTAVLVKAARQVIAVELDEKLAVKLTKRISADNLTVIGQDILKFDFGSLPAGYKIVANIPYYLTGKLLRVLSETANPPATAVLLVQKEVAGRVAAEPGKLSILGVTTQFYWQVSLGRLVPAEFFTPPPKVDSQVLVLERRIKPLFADIEPRDFFRVVKAGFAHPRKTLLNNLSAGLGITRDATQAKCASAGIDPGRRAQTLSLEEWHKLYRALDT